MIDAVAGPYLLVHSQGKKDVGAQSALAAAKALRGDAHDCVGMQVELNGLSDDARIAGKVVLPQVVAQNRDGRARSLVAFGGYQSAAKIRLHAQHLEIIRRGQRSVDTLRLGRPGDRNVVVVIPDQARQGPGVLAQIHEIRIGERRTGMLAALAALDGEHAVDILRPRNWIEERSADPTQDCACGAYPQSQRKHRREREARRAAQLPQCISKVCQQ